MKRTLILSIIVLLLNVGLNPIIQVVAVEQSLSETNVITSEEETEGKLVQVTLYSDEDKTIIAEVPEFYEEEYINKLQDENFRQQEISKSSGDLEIQSNFQLQATKASKVTYMRKNEVLRVLDSMNKSGNWLRYISNPITDGVVAAATRVLTKSNFVAASVVVLSWAASDLVGRQQKWWNDSALMILRGQIRGVKLTITPSGKDYPKIYRTLTRY